MLLLEQRELARLLDALGERLDRERLAELDERADQGVPFGVTADAGDERAVDLQGVDGEALEIGQGGVAGAEVVDRDAHAELLDRDKSPGGLLSVAHQRRLGDLDRQRARLEPTLR